MVSRRPRCRSCNTRCAQRQYNGLCHGCVRSDGRYHKVLSEINLARNAEHVSADALTPRAPITRVIDGVEYEMMWDGA